MSKIRYTPPSFMTTIISILKSKDDMRKSQILRPALIEFLLISDLTWKTNAAKILKQLADDGLLLIKNNKVSLPKSVPQVDHDYYCFECHLPGVLEKCQTCHRAFHKDCSRKNPERSNNMPNSYVHFDVDDDDHITNSSLSNLSNNKEISGLNETIISLNDTDEYVEDLKPELAVIYVGETRPPSRKRSASHIQPNVEYKREKIEEVMPNVEQTTLCTCCRLLLISSLRHPPNLGSEELCYLLGKSFTKFSKHIKFDLATLFGSKKLTLSEVNYIKSLLCLEYWNLKDIKYKLAKNQYKYTLEFLIDLLNLLHVAGVIYGKEDHNYINMYEFVHALNQDLSEIIRCPDCFRHSHEKHTLYWFAKPCTQRHEVVLARTRGSPYWPAKVMHVLKDSRHIVRYFGGKHDRAIITADNIHAFEIDINDKQIFKKKNAAFIHAMNEAFLYISLSSQYTKDFSYYADKKIMETIIESMVPNTVKKDKIEPAAIKPTPLSSIVENNNAVNIQETGSSLRQRTRSCRRSIEVDLENSNGMVDKKHKMLEDEIAKLKRKIKQLEAENRRLKLQKINNISKKGKKDQTIK